MKTVIKIASLFMLAVGSFVSAHAQVPNDSLYKLELPLTDQDGRAFHMADRNGEPQLVSMFYSSCQYTCPLIVEAIKKYQGELSVDERKKLQVLLVSFDPKRDTPARLKEVRAQRHIDDANWTLAMAESPVVRKLAAALDIQYREVDGGNFSHSSVIVLLSADGRLLARTDKLGEPDADFVQALHAALSTH